MTDVFRAFTGGTVKAERASLSDRTGECPRIKYAASRQQREQHIPYVPLSTSGESVSNVLRASQLRKPKAGNAQGARTKFPGPVKEERRWQSREGRDGNLQLRWEHKGESQGEKVGVPEETRRAAAELD